MGRPSHCVVPLLRTISPERQLPHTTAADAHDAPAAVVHQDHTCEPGFAQDILLLDAQYVLYACPDVVWYMDEQFGSDL